MGRQKKITEYDISIYDAIYRWYETKGPGAPSIRDIMNIAGHTSTGAARNSLEKLVEIGVVDLGVKTARTIRLTGETWQIPPKIDIRDKL